MSTDTLSNEVKNFNWMLDNFVEKSAGVCDAVAVSSDGLLMAMSHTLDRAGAERVAAIISGTVGLSRGAAKAFGWEPVRQIIIAMEGGYLFLSTISDGSNLGVLANAGCDIGLVGLPDQPFVGKDRGPPDPRPHRPVASAGTQSLRTKGPGDHARHTKPTRAHPPVHPDGWPYHVDAAQPALGNARGDLRRPGQVGQDHRAANGPVPRRTADIDCRAFSLYAPADPGSRDPGGGPSGYGSHPDPPDRPRRGRTVRPNEDDRTCPCSLINQRTAT